MKFTQKIHSKLLPWLVALFIGVCLAHQERQLLLNMSDPIPDLVTSSSCLNNSNEVQIKILASTIYTGWFPMGPISTVVAQLALDRLKTLPNWLPSNYQLAFEVYDDQADDPVVISEMLKKLLENDNTEGRFPIAALTDGSQASLLMSALLLKPFNFIGVNIFPVDTRFFFQRGNFLNYYAIGERVDYYFIALSKFLNKMGWRKVAVISDMAPMNAMVDNFLVSWLENGNITLLYMVKLQYQTEDDYELTSTFEEMTARKPRIIIMQAFNSVTIACYLHRYNMFGPNYAIFILSWNSFDENAEIPSFLSSWCKREMLVDVLESVIVYGDTTLADVNGSNATDLTGLSTNQLFEHVYSTVDHPDLCPAWQYWAPVYYDRYLFIGILLNETEHILNERNMTLSDWAANSRNFLENGLEIVEIIKEAIYRVSLVGLKGEYQFDRKTAWTSGSVPVVFNQIQFSTSNGNSSHPEVVGYYKSNRKDEPLVMHWDRFVWHTADSTAPADSLTILNSYLPIIPFGVNSALKVIASLEILAVVIILASMTIANKSKRRSWVHFTMLFGDALWLIHILVIPIVPVEQLGRHCTAIFLLIIAGSSLIISSINSKLAHFLSLGERIGVHSFRSSRRNLQVATRSITIPVNDNKTELLVIAWSGCQIVLLGIILGISPITTKRVYFDMFASSTDGDFAYQPVRFECKIMESLFGSVASTVLTSLLAFMQLGALISATYKSVRLQSENKKRQQPESKTATKRLPIFVYCTVICIVATGFIAVLRPDDGQFLAILISIFVIFISTLNVGLLALPFVQRQPTAAAPPPNVISLRDEAAPAHSSFRVASHAL